jgi:hypothetical protein
VRPHVGWYRAPVPEREVLRNVPWPFPAAVFPDNLGVVVQRTVLSGDLPALVVIHDADNDWVVGDGINDPNAPDACVVAHMSHVVGQDSSVSHWPTCRQGVMHSDENLVSRGLGLHISTTTGRSRLPARRRTRDSGTYARPCLREIIRPAV